MSNISITIVLKQIFNAGGREVCEIVNYVVIIHIISIFGVVANVINLVVFYKQGFSNTMNISFFGLAISDLFGLVAMFWATICVNPLFVHSNLPLAAHDLFYVSGDNPHSFCARITGWITVYITAERCLCIMMPLKIKEMITPKRTTVIIFLIYVVILATLLPIYGAAYIDWIFQPETNRSIIAFIFTDNKEQIEQFVFSIYFVQGLASFVAVIVFTVCLIVQLKQKSKWRSKANIDKTASGTISSRERKTVTMVVMIATVLIVCYAPGAAASMVTFFVPEFSNDGLYVNDFAVTWSFAFIFHTINSSVNIFLYYKMSSKYRDTFNKIYINSINNCVC